MCVIFPLKRDVFLNSYASKTSLTEFNLVLTTLLTVFLASDHLIN